MARTEVFDESAGQKIANLLVGRKVTKVADDQLVLDDGTQLRLVGNDGGCSCGAGDYTLTELNGVDNVITSVMLAADPGGDHHIGSGTYKIYVYADNEKINLATFKGTDGNGYYGTGFEIHVTYPDQVLPD